MTTGAIQRAVEARLFGIDTVRQNGLMCRHRVACKHIGRPERDRT
jgi:hypothetical protein